MHMPRPITFIRCIKSSPYMADPVTRLAHGKQHPNRKPHFDNHTASRVSCGDTVNPGRTCCRDISKAASVCYAALVQTKAKPPEVAPAAGMSAGRSACALQRCTEQQQRALLRPG